MIGSKHLSDLITDPDLIKPGYINILEANVSGGKTYFALNNLPQWTGSPAKILYLIDTLNGDMRIRLQNLLTISRQDYQLCDYGRIGTWGQPLVDFKGKMPIMTYAGFGSEVKQDERQFWRQFDYIVCDEIQNLVKYQTFDGDPTYLEAAETALRQVALEGKTRIIGMSATPQKAYEQFGELCRTIQFDRTDLIQLETFERIPYRGPAEELLPQLKGKCGILYIEHISDMRRILVAANLLGIPANGFWSTSDNTQLKDPFTPEQWKLHDTVLQHETIPTNIDLLVINASSETSIKIKGENRKVDFMIVHHSNTNIQTQVRGRYHGDLPQLFYHNPSDANLEIAKSIPLQYLNKPLYKPDTEELCRNLNIKKPNDPNYVYKWTTIKKLLQQNGYEVIDHKDKAKNGAHFYIIKSGTKTGMAVI